MTENTKDKSTAVKHCFVIGPIGERDSEIRAHADDLIKYIIAPVISEFGYGDPERSDLMPEPGRITTQIIRQLKEADLVIADLTFGNPNVYYELSLRHALGSPLIHMVLDDGTRLPFDVADGRTIFFHLLSRRAEAARNELRSQLQHIEANGFRASNPIVDALQILNLESSTQPLENLVGRLMSKVDALNATVSATSNANNVSIRKLIDTAVANSQLRSGALSTGLNLNSSSFDGITFGSSSPMPPGLLGTTPPSSRVATAGTAPASVLGT